MAWLGIPAGKHHADRRLGAIFRQRGQEQIDRVISATPARGEAKPILAQGEGDIRRDDIDVGGLDAETLVDLRHRHPGLFRQDLGQQALVLGIQMLDDDIRHVAGGRQGRQELRDGFETAG